MKIIVVPDVHGQDHWKKAKDKIDAADRIVILGDFFDHWTTGYGHQMSNAREIVNFKLQNKDKVCLCWANHDTSYYLDERCSGYQYDFAFEIQEFFRKNKVLFDVVFIFDNWIFSHGGISKEWMKCSGIKSPYAINELFKNKPNYFRWVGPDAYGNNYNEGPFWIRPEALKKTALDNWSFVCGHTEVNDNETKAPIAFNHENKGKIILVDTPGHDNIMEIDTITGEYRII
jgi:metallophosphoesterase superfamily enzyme